MLYNILYLFFDILTLLFAVVAGIFFGNIFEPNITALLLAFFISRFLIYFLWFTSVIKHKLPIVRFFVHSLVFLMVLPIISSAAGIWFPSLEDLYFWFGVVPIAAVIISYSLHSSYKLNI